MTDHSHIETGVDQNQSRRWHQVQGDLRDPALQLRELIPDVLKSYAGLHKAAIAEGQLDVRTKELIALAVAVSVRCDGCIVSHARSLARVGASKQEVAEAIGVAILLTGGPGTVYGPRALEAFLEYLPDYQNR